MNILDDYLASPTDDKKAVLLKQIQDGVTNLLTRTELGKQLKLNTTQMRRLFAVLDVQYPSEDDVKQFKRIGTQHGSWTILQVGLVRYKSDKTNQLIHRLRVQPPEHLRYTGPEAITDMVRAARKGIVKVSDAAYTLCQCACGEIATVPTTDLTSRRSSKCRQCRNNDLSAVMKTAHAVNREAKANAL